jgi:hypothetical protein
MWTDRRTDIHDDANHRLCRFARALEMDDALRKLQVACIDMTQCGLAVPEQCFYFKGIIVAS